MQTPFVSTDFAAISIMSQKALAQLAEMVKTWGPDTATRMMEQACIKVAHAEAEKAAR